MTVYKGKRSVIKIEAETHGSLIASNAAEAALDLDFPKLPEIVFVLSLGKHNYVAADHKLLCDSHVLDAKPVLVQALGNNRFPYLSSGLVFALDHFFCAKFDHFLETHNNDIRHCLL